MALMVSDVLVAFDHLRHEVTDPGQRVRRGRTSRAPTRRRPRRSRTCASAWPAPVPRAQAAGRRETPAFTSNIGLGGLRGGRRAVQGVHPRRRRLPGGAQPALERRLPGRGVLDLPRAARDQPEPLHVLPRLRGLRDRRRLARVAGQGGRAATPSSGRSPARARGRDTAEEDLERGRGAAGRREGARRARDAGRPGPQRPRPRVRVRHR